MKSLSLVVVLLALAISAYATEESGWFVPQNDGSFRYWTVAQAEAYELIRPRRTPGGKPIIYNLFTKANPSEPQMFTTEDHPEEKVSHFNKNNPTRFIIHGWLIGDYESGTQSLITAAYLDPDFKDEDYNVFTVDWSYYADNPNYAEARYDAPKAALEIAAFIDLMNEKFGLDFKTLTLIGHSLGGQVAGMIGKNVKNGRVDTIYGLDPAGPLFMTTKPEKRLTSTDAEYVEVIHTDRMELGYAKPLGQADFYPNWGRRQPGCKYDLGGECSHKRVVLLFAEAVKMRSNNQFVPTKCVDYDSIKDEGRCNVLVDNSVKMGHKGNYKIANGVYFLPTRSESTFGRGYYYL